MARVTVEDCVIRVPNRFKLVMLAAQRSRELSVGGELTVERDDDKNPVVALREIAEETVGLDVLEESLIQGLQKNVDVDEPMDEAEELLAVEEALGNMAASEAAGEVAEDSETAAPVTGGFEDEPDPDADPDIGAEAEAKDEAEQPEED